MTADFQHTAEYNNLSIFFVLYKGDAFFIQSALHLANKCFEKYVKLLTFIRLFDKIKYRFMLII